MILGIDGKRVSPLQQITLGGIPESLAFSPDGRFLLVGNLLDQDIALQDRVRARGCLLLRACDRTLTQ